MAQPKNIPPAYTLDSTNRVRRAVVSIVAVVALGTSGYTIIEGWDPWQSLFFTLVTITTVGYGDYGLTVPGERFTAVLLLVGIALVTYSAGQLVQEAIEAQENGERRMRKRIKTLRKHQIVCGYGRIGRTVCQALANHGVAVVVIERNEKLIQLAIDDGLLVTRGDATTDTTLADAGIEWAAGIIALTSSDSENLVITIAAHEHRADIPVISRAESEESVLRMRRAGADRVISPIRVGGHSIAQAVVEPHLSSLVDVDEPGSVQLAELHLEGQCSLIGATIRKIGMEHPEVVFVSIRRAGTNVQLRPPVDKPLNDGDVLVIAGTRKSLNVLRDSTHRLAA